jgi:hypothetical protein
MLSSRRYHAYRYLRELQNPGNGACKLRPVCLLMGQLPAAGGCDEQYGARRLFSETPHSERNQPPCVIF